MLKSQIISMYSEIFKEIISQKVFSEKLERIVKILESEEFKIFFDNEENKFALDLVQPIINKEKHLPYKSIMFLLPLINQEDSRIVRKFGRNTYISVVEEYEWIKNLKKHEQDIYVKVNEIIKDKFNEKKIKEWKCLSHNSKISDNKKTDKHNQIKIKWNNQCNKECNEITENKDIINLLSHKIYKNLCKFGKKADEIDKLDERIERLILILMNLPYEHKKVIINKYEKIIEKEIINRSQQNFNPDGYLNDLEAKIVVKEVDNRKDYKEKIEQYKTDGKYNLLKSEDRAYCEIILKEEK